MSLIAALARNRVIGIDNHLPSRLPPDLQRFHAITRGKPVVMGRRTHESIGRALPDRRNIVVTRTGTVQPGCERAASLHEALALASPSRETMVIGGERCYREALPLAQRMYLTRIDADFAGDTWFPEWDPEEWIQRDREWFPPTTDIPFAYTFLVLERQQPQWGPPTGATGT